MAMLGRVRKVNPKNGFVAIETKGGFTIIELLGDEVSIGDEMSWQNDTGLGLEMYRNMTRGETINVFVQNHWVPPGALRKQLQLD